MFGSHLSIAGGVHKALIRAGELELDCLQIFTRNQVQWEHKRLKNKAISLWDRHRRRAGLAEVVSHGSYLLNLASPDAALYRRSVVGLGGELRRCGKLGIRLLVVHPGNHMGAGESAGLDRVARALDRVYRRTPAPTAITCLETTAGQGTGVGWRFEHLREILDRVSCPGKVGVCLDTAHMLAAGYRLTSAGGARAVLAECDAVIGLDRVHVVHVNDSKRPRGSRVDRHEHIGRGRVALTAFGVIVNHPHIRGIPKILETPKGDAPDGRAWDRVNLAKLRALVRG